MKVLFFTTDDENIRVAIKRAVNTMDRHKQKSLLYYRRFKIRINPDSEAAGSFFHHGLQLIQTIPFVNQ